MFLPNWTLSASEKDHPCGQTGLTEMSHGQRETPALLDTSGLRLSPPQMAQEQGRQAPHKEGEEDDTLLCPIGNQAVPIWKGDGGPDVPPMRR